MINLSKYLHFVLLIVFIVIFETKGQSKIGRCFEFENSLKSNTIDSVIINKVKVLFIAQTAMTDVVYINTDFLGSLFKNKSPFKLIELKGGDLPPTMSVFRIVFDSCSIYKNGVHYSQFHSNIEFYTYIDICRFKDFIIVVDDNLRVFRISGFSHNDISYLLDYQDVKLFKSKFLRISDSIFIPVSRKCKDKRY